MQQPIGNDKVKEARRQIDAAYRRYALGERDSADETRASDFYNDEPPTDESLVTDDSENHDIRENDDGTMMLLKGENILDIRDRNDNQSSNQRKSDDHRNNSNNKPTNKVKAVVTQKSFTRQLQPPNQILRSETPIPSGQSPMRFGKGSYQAANRVAEARNKYANYGPNTPIPQSPMPTGRGGGGSGSEPGTAKLEQMIMDEILDRTPSTRLSDVVGQMSAKQSLTEMILLPRLNPRLFVGLLAPPRALLMYGPPGCGKTMLARAVAHEANIRFFNISAATLVSKWVGESEKLVRCLFNVARRYKPSLVFIDEIDSVLSTRKQAENEVSRRLKTQFLLEVDGVGTNGADTGVILLGATNRPWDLDDAVIRRFTRRVHVPMPNREERAEIIESLLKKRASSTRQEQMLSAQISNRTQGYSASDLTNLCRDAAMMPLRMMTASELQKLSPSSIRNPELSDFSEALRRTKPSVGDEVLHKYQEWTSRYGSGAIGHIAS